LALLAASREDRFRTSEGTVNDVARGDPLKSTPKAQSDPKAKPRRRKAI